MNWRGRPLTSHETILQLIGATTTNTGLTVTATLDTGSYPIGIKISNREMAALPITRDEFLLSVALNEDVRVVAAAGVGDG